MNMFACGQQVMKEFHQEVLLIVEALEGLVVGGQLNFIKDLWRPEGQLTEDTVLKFLGCSQSSHTTPMSGQQCRMEHIVGPIPCNEFCSPEQDSSQLETSRFVNYKLDVSRSMSLRAVK
jgi:hypothetical protein